MINVQNVILRRGERRILEGTTFTVHAGQHVGLVGANGAGKTSLFQLIRGRLLPEEGDVQLPPRTRLAHLAQETPSSERSALAFVLDGDSELRRVQREIERAEAGGDHVALGRLHGELESIGGYAAEARAAAILHGLGFPSAAFDRPLDSFSGGWRMRLALARTLMQLSDILLLDEPTNHLDLDATLWLERWLERYPGTLLLISHDRDFLDRSVGYIAHLEHGRVTVYRGGYSSFERQRAEALERQRAVYEKHARRAEEIRRFAARFRAQANKARAVQSRLKELERLEAAAPVRATSPFRFAFRDPQRVSTPLVSGRELVLGYAGQRVLSDVRLTLLPGARVGLLGPNGAGKSTLMKLLAERLEPLAGELTRGRHAQVAFFAQHQLDQLALSGTPLAHLLELDPRASEQQARDFLGGFGFGEQAVMPVETFSGGERARLVLALLAWSRPALLLLDEPTNHLDIEMREALALALQDYGGAVVLVSHDRHLLRQTVDEYWLVADGGVRSWQGDLDDYAGWLLARGGGTPGAEGAASGLPGRARGAGGVGEGAPARPRVDRKAERREAARRRERLKPLKARITTLERRIEAGNRRLGEIEARLAEETLYGDDRRDELTELLREQGELRSALEREESAWLQANEEYEDLAATDP